MWSKVNETRYRECPHHQPQTTWVLFLPRMYWLFSGSCTFVTTIKGTWVASGEGRKIVWICQLKTIRILLRFKEFWQNDLSLASHSILKWNPFKGHICAKIKMRHKTDVRNLQCFGQRMATKNVCFCGSKNAQSFGEAEKVPLFWPKNRGQKPWKKVGSYGRLSCFCVVLVVDAKEKNCLKTCWEPLCTVRGGSKQ